MLQAFSRENAVTVVQLIYESRVWESNSKDYEFSRATMLEHWAAGLADAARTVADRRGDLLKARRGATTVFDSRIVDRQAHAKGDRP